MKCINCGFEHGDKFCPNCGERSELRKITFNSVFCESFSTLTNMDRGFLFNVKNLFLNPSGTVHDYINGKRKNIFNPLSFLIIAISIYLLIDSLFVTESVSDGDDSKFYSIGYEAGRFIALYYKYFWISSILWLSISTRLLFRKYNFAEHLAINSFVVGQSTLVGIISFLIFRNELIFDPLVYISIFWITYEIFKERKRDSSAFVLVLISMFFFFVQMIIVITLIGVIRSWEYIS
ncbi:MAG: DUF3667 domain-containing protein [Balneola sp.]|nr:MAG: DUF3667 domain-containing protein [Balneola sp.]